MKKQDGIHCEVKGCKQRKMVDDEKCESHVYQKYAGVFTKEFTSPASFDNSDIEGYN